MLIDLYTPEGENLSGTPWQVYPRPQMRRDSYLNLNGEWAFSVMDGEDRKILVPFCPESSLSGIKKHFPEGSILCYKRTFTLPDGFHRGRVILHIGAVDQVADVYVNDKHVGHHEGGYEAFSFDISEMLAAQNTLEVRCMDDLRMQEYPYGKQTLTRGGMWYTPVSGIWQTVWLESVPETYIKKLNIENRGATVTIDAGDPALTGTVTVAGLGSYALTEGKVTITPEDPHFWSPEDPYLYEFIVEAGEDRV